MGKLEELARLTAGNVNDSLGVGRTPRPDVLPGATAPARWQGVTKSKNAVEIPVDKIERDPGQPREEFDEDALNRLAESLKARGQLQPIRVRWDEGRGVYLVMVGERRWRAARMAGLPTLSAVVVDGPIEPGELLAVQLIENCLREDLKPIEQAKAFKALMEQNGWSARQVARELAIDHTGVARALALLTLPEAVQDDVEAGRIAPRTAYELSKIEDPIEQADAARDAAAGLLKRDDAARRASKPARAKGKGANKPRKVTTRVFRTAAGPRLTVEWRKGLDDDLVRAALADAMVQLDSARPSGDSVAA
ncbi:MAG: ParB/RepB/Spo0J family partition protein [Planctomycetaceae bacterium]|nr:ParB/RepB/Spo0J family partition protein [Planctomycetaceae bacterium]